MCGVCVCVRFQIPPKVWVQATTVLLYPLQYPLKPQGPMPMAATRRWHTGALGSQQVAWGGGGVSSCRACVATGGAGVVKGLPMGFFRRVYLGGFSGG